MTYLRLGCSGRNGQSQLQSILPLTSTQYTLRECFKNIQYFPVILCCVADDACENYPQTKHKSTFATPEIASSFPRYSFLPHVVSVKHWTTVALFGLFHRWKL